MRIIRKAWFSAGFACLLLLGLALGWVSSGISSAQTSPTGDQWQKIPDVPTNVDFRDVFMSGGSGIAVGQEGDHGAAYDLQWTALDGWRNSLAVSRVGFNFRAPLWAAVMVNEEEWAVGEEGLIAHKQNGGWNEVAGPVPDAKLVTLQMLGNGDEGWAGGFRMVSGAEKPEPVLLHYVSGLWQRDESITGQGTINALHFAQGGGWAVGDAGIWRYYRGVWSKEQEPNPCPETGCFQTYNSVRAINSDEAWIAGSRMGLCGICVPEPYILHRENGKWQIAVDTVVQGDPTNEGLGRELHGLTFSDYNPNLPMLGWAVGTIRTGDALKPYILSHIDGHASSDWQYVPYPADTNAQLTSVSVPDRDHAMAVGTGGTILSYGYGAQPPPTLTPTPAATMVGGSTPTPTAPSGQNATQPVADPHVPGVAYFGTVGHTLRGGFRDYWEQHGGLAQFGYPLTEEFTEVSATDGMPYTTQYFERARFEYHPENPPPYDVLLGLLGRTITTGQENEAPFMRTPAEAGPGTIYFDVTGHNMPRPFSGYWQEHGGLPVYGYPISEAFDEVSPTDGKTYLVQYFERNRLEYHPELNDLFKMSLGLLGVQVLQDRGWIAGPTAVR